MRSGAIRGAMLRAVMVERWQNGIRGSSQWKGKSPAKAAADCLRAWRFGVGVIPAEEAKKVIQDCTYLQLDSTKTFSDVEPALYQKAIEEYKAGIKENREGYKELLEPKQRAHSPQLAAGVSERAKTDRKSS